MLLFTALIWGTGFVFQRMGMETAEPITFNAARMALAAVVIGPAAIMLWRRRDRVLTEASPEYRKDYGRNTLLGGICCGVVLSAASIFQQMGLVYTSAGKAGFITAMYLLLVPVMGFIFLRRRNTLLVWIAVAMGVAGMYFLCLTEDFSLSQGDTLVCMCAVFYSVHILCCDYFVQKGHTICISAIQFATAAVVSTAAAFLLETPSMERLASAVTPIAYCGLVSGGTGYTLQMVGQKHTDPTSASLIMSMESVFAVVTGALMLHEKMTLREIAGCVIMLAAIILVQLPVAEIRGRLATAKKGETDG